MSQCLSCTDYIYDTDEPVDTIRSLCSACTSMPQVGSYETLRKCVSEALYFVEDLGVLFTPKLIKSQLDQYRFFQKYKKCENRDKITDPLLKSAAKKENKNSLLGLSWFSSKEDIFTDTYSVDCRDERCHGNHPHKMGSRHRDRHTKRGLESRPMANEVEHPCTDLFNVDFFTPGDAYVSLPSGYRLASTMMLRCRSENMAVVNKILVTPWMPVLRVIGSLVHELVHAYILIKRFAELGEKATVLDTAAEARDAEEGFCYVVSCAYWMHVYALTRNSYAYESMLDSLFSCKSNNDAKLVNRSKRHRIQKILDFSPTADMGLTIEGADYAILLKWISTNLSAAPYDRAAKHAVEMISRYGWQPVLNCITQRGYLPVC